MQIALISPIQFQELSQLLPGRFCIATLAARDQFKSYREWFVTEQQIYGDVILDNGTFEGPHLDEKQLIELALLMQPRVLICPDKINAPAQENWNYARDFANAYHTSRQKLNATGDITNAPTPCELMFVPQCEKNECDALGKVLRNFIDDDTFQWLGICRDVCSHAIGQYTGTDDQELNRFFFGAYLQRIGMLQEMQVKGKKIHFLGMGDQIHMLQYYWYVDSIDTASLLWQAMYGNIVSEEGFLHTTLKRPYNYFFLDDVELDHAEGHVIFMNNLRYNCQMAQKYAEKATVLRRQILGGRL